MTIHGRLNGLLILLLIGSSPVNSSQKEALYLLDDLDSHPAEATVGGSWRLISDQVMGGLSQGALTRSTHQGRSCLRLTGKVSTENSGGFLQMALELDDQAGAFDASGFDGLEIDIAGNGEAYNLHLRTTQLWLPWQSFRVSFTAEETWKTLRLPFEAFSPYRSSSRLDSRRLTRIGLLAIGRDFSADLCLARLLLYRD